MSVLFNKANLTDKSLNLANFNRIVDYVGRLANMTSPNMMIDRNPNGYVLKVLPSTSSIMSYSDWAFGFSISGNVVTVTGGTVWQGTRPPVTVAGSQTINVLADYTWVYVEGSWGYPNAGVYPPSILSGTTRPAHNSTTYRFPLHLWRLVGGVASLERIHHLGDIFIPGVYA